MTLRVRLVAGLVALSAVGLVLFGVVTTALYDSAQYRQLDQQLRAAVPLVRQALQQRSGVPLGARALAPGGLPPAGSAGSAPPGAPGGAEGGGEPPVLGAYGALIGPDGATVATVQLSSTTAVPALGAALVAQPGIHATGSVRGSVGWRVDVLPRLANGYRVVVAVPTTPVVDSVQRLTLIEVGAGAALLLALSAGAWLMLRRGLAPLERMAATARRIADGDLTERAAVRGAGEVAALGSALDTMLDEIEAAFAARDATEQRLRQFLADASHELRTPLTSIQGFAELLRMGAAEDAGQRSAAVARIEGEADRMRRLVEDLLLLARLDRVEASAPRPVDLTVLAADACGDARVAAPDRPVTLDAPAPVVVAGDEGHLRQAVGNLVANALRHTPPGTAVEVAVRRQGGEAQLDVQDHGPGLDAAAMAHAFDRFWRGDPARTGEGSGLGLSIVAGVMAEHGGRVEVADVPGGGARFRLRLPVAPAGAAAPPPGPPGSVSPPGVPGRDPAGPAGGGAPDGEAPDRGAPGGGAPDGSGQDPAGIRRL